MLAVLDAIQVKTVTPATMDAILAESVGGSRGVTTNDAAATGSATNGEA